MTGVSKCAKRDGVYTAVRRIMVRSLRATGYVPRPQGLRLGLPHEWSIKVKSKRYELDEYPVQPYRLRLLPLCDHEQN
jgi:hypothetical protein